jgi:hypothetical protein
MAEPGGTPGDDSDVDGLVFGIAAAFGGEEVREVEHGFADAESGHSGA